MIVLLKLLVFIILELVILVVGSYIGRFRVKGLKLFASSVAMATSAIIMLDLFLQIHKLVHFPLFYLLIFLGVIVGLLLSIALTRLHLW